MAEGISDRPMTAEDAADLWREMAEEQRDYLAHFNPFSSQSDFVNAIAGAERDVYFSLLQRERLVGFFMLRGLDLGFRRPSFGIYVNSRASGQGVARYALQRAINICRQRGLRRIMLKVSPRNERAYRLYQRKGFQRRGLCTDTGHIIMEMESDGVS